MMKEDPIIAEASLVEPLLIPSSSSCSVSVTSRSTTSTCSASSGSPQQHMRCGGSPFPPDSASTYSSYWPYGWTSHHHQFGIVWPASVILRVVAAILLLLVPPFWVFPITPEWGLLENLQSIVNVWDALLRMSCVLTAVIALIVSVYLAPKVVGGCQHQHQYGYGYAQTRKHSRSYELPQSPSSSYDSKDDNDNDTCTSNAGDEDCGATIRSAASASSAASGTLGILDALPEKRQPQQQPQTRRWVLHLTPDRLAVLLAFAIGLPPSTMASLPLVFPSWIWFPLGWATYRVYRPSELQAALQGVCPHQALEQEFLPLPAAAETRPLCLSEASWNTLSAGALSSYNPQHVQAVLQGIQYVSSDAKHGLVLALLARDIQDKLTALQQNIESLVPFFGANHNNLAVVIFENDSQDGSRHAIRQWAAQQRQSPLAKYQVDLMDCPESTECQLGTLHRDSDQNQGGYAKSKSVGAMHIYRQRVVDHILQDPNYQNHYSHMMVLDMDLAVSISPLGILHTLGQIPDHVVASTGHTMYIAGFGSLQTPYDFSAFVPWPTEANDRVRRWHERWCHMMPAGDRWRNACGASSPLLTAEVMRNDRRHDRNPRNNDFYPVVSAFNGAVLYPLERIRTAGATYDDGGDGQRCEHIGFHLHLVDQHEGSPMYVNRKWDMKVDPTNPGGPTGWRAQNAISHVMLTPRLIFSLIGIQTGSYVCFVYAVSILGMFVVYPLLCPVVSGGRHLKRLVSSHHRKHMKQQQSRRQRQTQAQQLLSPDDEQLLKLV